MVIHTNCQQPCYTETPPAGASGFDTNFTKGLKHVITVKRSALAHNDTSTSQLISHKYTNQTETCLFSFDLSKVPTGERALGNCLERGRNNFECIWSQCSHFKCANVIGRTWLDAVQCGIQHHSCQGTWDTG